LPNYRV